ncbi:hypothetical protein [Microbacterium sp. SS28]|uniref:hypothetical protein n=1 Tax=Microbacterium sp. SS28 TaxID=2919948 RepID=UPI001FAA6B35|nr:hypothetical protein [Microbacterium sp. SS28]
MKHTRTAAIVAALAAALLALATAPASAAPAEIDHWTDSVTHIEQEAHEAWCPDVPFLVLYHEDSHGNFHGVERRGAFYGGSSFHVEASWTNVENGKSFSLVQQGVDKDHLVIPQEDGTIMLTFLNTGASTYYDNDGKRMFVDAGRTFGTVHLDADYNFIEFIEADAKGHFETAGRDFCADVMEFIG